MPLALRVTFSLSFLEERARRTLISGSCCRKSGRDGDVRFNARLGPAGEDAVTGPGVPGHVGAHWDDTIEVPREGETR